MAIKFPVKNQLQREAKRLAKNVVMNSGQYGKTSIAVKDVQVWSSSTQRNLYKFYAKAEATPLTLLGKLKAMVLGASGANHVFGEVHPLAKFARITQIV